jgi:hypothetical protein
MDWKTESKFMPWKSSIRILGMFDQVPIEEFDDFRARLLIRTYGFQNTLEIHATEIRDSRSWQVEGRFEGNQHQDDDRVEKGASRRGQSGQ